MEVEYKKDLRHNYMVITKNDEETLESYSLRMLESQTIEGILPVEMRRMDNNTLLYYDITAKQSMAAILDKAALSYDKVRELFAGIIDTIDRAYEFLLPEDDFILASEYIYIEVTSGKPVLCFLPGYGKRIKEQMSSLIEYLMNKVDYNDKEAVLLIYQLYADSREEGYTFDHLAKVLQEKPQINLVRKGQEEEADRKEEYSNRITDKREEYSCENANNHTAMKGINNFENGNAKISVTSEKQSDKEACISGKVFNRDEFKKREGIISLKEALSDKRDNIDDRIPVMMERVEKEEEAPCYPVKTYIYTGACAIGGILLIILSLEFKIIYNSFGSRIDYTKLLALLLIVLCVEGYLFKLIWDKKNRITKIVTKNEYIDPRQNSGSLEFYKNHTERGGLSESHKNHMEMDGQPEFRKSHMEKESLSESHENLIGTGSLPGASIQDGGRIHRPVPKDTCSDRDGMQLNMPNISINKKIGDGLFIQEEEDNPTCILNADYPEAEDKKTADDLAGLHLKPQDEIKYQPIPITEFPFFIGKLKKNVDYCLKDDTVSRYHAKITKEEDRYYITDLNSTNGTFINNVAIQTYEKKEIVLGDEIAFANIRYQFVR